MHNALVSQNAMIRTVKHDRERRSWFCRSNFVIYRSYAQRLFSKPEMMKLLWLTLEESFLQ